MDISIERHSAVHAMVVFRQAARTISMNSNEVIREMGLTNTQFTILDALYCKGDMAIFEIKDKLLATSGNLTVVLKNMVRNGWITRACSPTDKRQSVFSITKTGRDLFEKVLPPHREKLNEVFGILSEEERAQLITILKKFKQLN